MAIITSLLDTDLYKLTMQQVALHQFPTVDVKYEYKCRNDIKFSMAMYEEIKQEVESYCNLMITEEEIQYLKSIRFLKPDFIDFLKLYKPSNSHVSVRLEEPTGELKISVYGPWYLTIPFEVPILAIVNEVYFRHSLDNHSDKVPDKLLLDGEARLSEKIKIANSEKFTFSEFGTRRRFNKSWQRQVIAKLSKECSTFIGTSNVAFAKELGIKPMGTMAHEFIMVGQGREDIPLRNSQKAMLQAWVDEYRGDLGIALTDTMGLGAFLKDFDLYFAKLYDGLRHDSGDPIWWAKQVIQHYREMGIDPKTKTLVFSDGLNFNLCTEIFREISPHANVSFGIGTNLTNDFADITPLQIVMKLVKVNKRPVAKISDTPNKGMCKDQDFLDYLNKVFRD